jgi:hypothetical protein
MLDFVSFHLKSAECSVIMADHAQCTFCPKQQLLEIVGYGIGTFATAGPSLIQFSAFILLCSYFGILAPQKDAPRHAYLYEPLLGELERIVATKVSK